jgi:pyruvate/2-oxoglutarate dehydrogenase complex dihydrolipoamide dehydrogenase (E3) component
MLRRRDGVASRWTDDGQVSWLSQAEITLYRSQGRIDGPRSVEVIGHDTSTTTVDARHAVVATGTSALVPDVPGRATTRLRRGRRPRSECGDRVDRAA